MHGGELLILLVEYFTSLALDIRCNLALLSTLLLDTGNSFTVPWSQHIRSVVMETAITVTLSKLYRTAIKFCGFVPNLQNYIYVINNGNWIGIRENKIAKT